MFDVLHNAWAWGAGLAALGLIGGIGAGVWFLGGMGLLTWLTGSWLGRRVAALCLAALAVLVVAAKIFAAGQAKEKAKQQAATAKAIKDRITKDDEIGNLSADERHKRLDRWVRD